MPPRPAAVRARRAIAFVFAAAIATFVTGAGVLGSASDSVLPNGWLVRPSQGMMAQTDTMPQGAALSRDGKTLAVVASGFNPATLHLYAAADLKPLATVALTGAFGRPLWLDATHVLVAGANADALLDVNISTQTVATIAMPNHSYPTLVATADGKTFAAATDGDSSVRLGTLDTVAGARPVAIGGHIGGLAFAPDGKTLYASDRSGSSIEAIDTTTLGTRRIATGLHPSDILPVGSEVYVAESDADAVGVYDAAGGARLAEVFVGYSPANERLAGASPNALARQGDSIFVSLGAANSVAVIRDRHVVGRLAAGWYPTDVVPAGERLYIIDGKGEGTRANPGFNPKHRGDRDYVAAIQYGSIRSADLSQPLGAGNPPGAQGWHSVQGDAVVRAGGPIRHVFFILKENRTYDQILGDVAAGNGDPALAWFGARVTPNQHAIAARFGLFDNTYASGEVSDSGHNWADAAFADDYVERTWPVVYGGRQAFDDLGAGSGAAVPRNGFIWQSAQAAHVSFRDYGERTGVSSPAAPAIAAAPSLQGRYDPRYVGWNLDYSDLDRVKEWRREFDGFVRNGDVPQLEYIWLPNDHTYASRRGKLTPVSYVAQNDYAVGQIVDAISHSPIWSSSAIFITEDDAQNGPDHVSAQRTTFFLASPYARGGLQHAHYSTVGVLATMERILGLQPLSAYDGMAVPMYAAFSPHAREQPFRAIAPKVSITARNSSTAYAAKASDGLNFSRPDANSASLLSSILARNREIAGRGTAMVGKNAASWPGSRFR